MWLMKKTAGGMEIDISRMPQDSLYKDIGPKTVEGYAKVLKRAGTIFCNGPAGVYEEENFSYGTRKLWQAVADSPAYSVIGGGDTVSSAEKFIDTSKIGYVCTAGGAMVRFMSGKKLPLIMAMEKAYENKKPGSLK